MFLMTTNRFPNAKKPCSCHAVLRKHLFSFLIIIIFVIFLLKKEKIYFTLNVSIPVMPQNLFEYT